MNLRIFKDSKLFIAIILSAISFLGIQPFGDFTRGVVYGIVLLYSILFLLFNLNSIDFKNKYIYLAVTFYIYTSIILAIHGDILDVGFAHLQVFFLTLCATINKKHSLHDIFISISKVLTILSLIMGIGSIILLFVPEEYWPIISRFSQKLGDKMGTFVWDYRMSGLGLNANVTAGFVALGFMASMHLFLEQPKNKKWSILSILNGLQATIIICFLCNSRTSILTIGIFSIIYPIFRIIISKKKKSITPEILILAILSLLLIISISVIFTNNQIKMLFKEKILRIHSLETGSGRTVIWNEYITKAKDNILLGVPRTGFSLESSHNVFIDIMTFTGIIGLTLYLLHYISSLIILMKNVKKEKNRNIQEANTYIFLIIILLVIFIQGFIEYFIFLRYNITGLFTAYALGSAISLNSKALKNERSKDEIK